MTKIFAFTCLGLLLSGCGMFGKEFVLCSRFAGQLVDQQGKPVPSVRIERTWTWHNPGKSGSDEAVTDANGRFDLPRVTGKSLFASLVATQPVIGQKITAHGPAGAVLIWGYSKTNYDDNGELEGRPINVVCRADKDPSGEFLFLGTCVEAK